MRVDRKFWNILALLIFILASACAPAPSPVPDGLGAPGGAVASGDLAAPVTPDQPAATTEGRVTETAPVVEREPSTETTALAEGVIPSVGPESSGLIARNSEDGKSYRLIAVDLNSGMPVEHYDPIELGYEFNYRFTPDRRELIVAGKLDGCPSGCLQLIDLVNWRVRERLELGFLRYSTDWISSIVYDGANRRLYLVLSMERRSRLIAIDLIAGQILAETRIPVAPRAAALTTDTRGLMLVGSEFTGGSSFSPEGDQRLRALLVDAATLQITWGQPLDEVQDGLFSPSGSQHHEDLVLVQAAVIVSPVSDQIYIAHAGADRLTTVDFERQQVRTTDVRERRTWFEEMVEAVLSVGVRPVQAKVMNMTVRSGVISPDGEELYLVRYRTEPVEQDGEVQIQWHTDGLQVWNLAEGTIEARLETEATSLRHGLGKQVLLHSWDTDTRTATSLPTTAYFDPDRREIVDTVYGVQAASALRLDGTEILVSSITNARGQNVFAVIGADGYRPRFEWADGEGVSSFWLEWTP